MEVKARLRFARTGTLKAREVARLIVGQDVNTALNILSFNHRKPALLMGRLLKSAVSLAEAKKVLDVDSLYVKSVCVNQAPHLKRFRPRAKGSSSPYRRKQSHIDLILVER